MLHPSDLAISIHAPREGCDEESQGDAAHETDISIHAPREGCDALGDITLAVDDISIHAPREGCDARMHQHTHQPDNFNPRTP